MTTVESTRCRLLLERPRRPAARYVLYWMQASQRAEHNPALESAARMANDNGVPLVVVGVVVPDYPEANRRHFGFMLGGLGHAMQAVERRGMRPCVRVGDPVEIVAELSSDAAELVVDRGYLRHQVAWYRKLVDQVDCRVTQVEGDVVVPVDEVSDHQEAAARTIRGKINAARNRYLADLGTVTVDDRTRPQGTVSDIDLDEFTDIDRLLGRLGLDVGPEPARAFKSGTPAARSALADFLDGLEDYEDSRNRYNQPDGTSRLSPYLHFGQISPVVVATAAVECAGDRAEPFLEELIVRRELAINYVVNNAHYDSFRGLPEWARRSLAAHADDEREHVYTAAELEAGETHDETWNAIMGVIRTDGWVHNQLRMYWGKQIVHWTNTPEYALRTLLDLNNRYFLDGRDPSSYANVAWCFGLHDQGFKDRQVSGKLRPFTTAALKRKDDLAAWVGWAADRASGSSGP